MLPWERREGSSEREEEADERRVSGKAKRRECDKKEGRESEAEGRIDGGGE